MSEEKEVEPISDPTHPDYSRTARYNWLVKSLWGKSDGSGGRWTYEDASSAAHDTIVKEWDAARNALAWHGLTGE